MTYFREMLETWSNHSQTSFPMAHFSTKHYATNLHAYQSKADSSIGIFYEKMVYNKFYGLKKVF